MIIIGVLIRSIITPLRIKDPREDPTARGHLAPKARRSRNRDECPSTTAIVQSHKILGPIDRT